MENNPLPQPESQQSPVQLTKKERRMLRREEKRTDLAKTKIAQKRSSWIKIAAGILIIGGLGFGIFKFFTTAPEGGNASADPLKTCVNHGGGAGMHIHLRLSIKVNGVEQDISKDIGISTFCMKPIHTHDSSGTIHIEFPRQHDFKLADFFAVWDRPFPRSDSFLMTVNGATNTEFANHILKDGEQIEISYEKVQ